MSIFGPKEGQNNIPKKGEKILMSVDVLFNFFYFLTGIRAGITLKFS